MATASFLFSGEISNPMEKPPSPSYSPLCPQQNPYLALIVFPSPCTAPPPPLLSSILAKQLANGEVVAAVGLPLWCASKPLKKFFNRSSSSATTAAFNGFYRPTPVHFEETTTTKMILAARRTKPLTQLLFRRLAAVGRRKGRIPTSFPTSSVYLLNLRSPSPPTFPAFHCSLFCFHFHIPLCLLMSLNFCVAVLIDFYLVEREEARIHSSAEMMLW